MIGLYLHIPFCKKKCHYCDFVITTNRLSATRLTFIASLEKEIAHSRDFLSGKTFETFYIGGGTPSVLSAGELEEIFSLVRKNFKLREDAEITCEVNPGDMTAEKAAAYAGLGINRASLGAQSFNDRTLKLINRDHSSKDILKSVHILRSVGFENISLDLILSLPEETLLDVKHSLNKLVSLGPEHVSLYELTIEEKTVFGNEFRKGRLKLPGEETQLEMLSFARKFLKEKGFCHYELLSYAKPGFRSRHNLLYWANEETLGLGPGAFSYFNGRRFRHSSSVDEYFEKIGNNDWSACEQETLHADKREIESFLLALRLSEGAPLSRFQPVMDKFQGNITGLIEKGLLERTRDRVCLTARGQFFAETVFTELSG